MLILSTSDECCTITPHSPHGVLSSIIAPKVPLIIDLHIPTDRPDRRRCPPQFNCSVPSPMRDFPNTDIRVV